MKYILLVISALCLTQISASAQKKNENKGYHIGSIAEDFSLKNIDGSLVSLAEFSDAKGFVICFTCNHCPFSIANEDRLIALNNKYAKLGYPLIAINPNDADLYPDDSYENMIKRADDKGFTFPYLYDEKQEVFPKYGATKTPHIYLLKKTTKGLEVMYMGAIDDSPRNEDEVSKHYLENAIDDLLNGRKIGVQETKAIGCSIKVKK